MRFDISKGLPLGVLAAFLCFDPAAAQQKAGTWETLPNLPNPRRLLAAATVDGRIYTFGGCGSPCFDPVLHPSTFEETLVEVYDPDDLPDGSWSARGPIPSVFFSGAAAALGDFIYLAGGVVSPNVLLRYDPEADSWTARAPMPTARHGLALTALGGKLYAVGGNGPSNALEVYDPTTDSWTAKTPMPTARVFLAAAALSSKLYAVGGSPDCCGDSQTDVLEIYDPATDSWTNGAPMPVAQQLSAAVAVHGQIYTFGGFIPGSGARDNVYGYDPSTDTWTEKTPMPTARDQSAAVLLDDGAHVLGGSVDCHCAALDTHERYVDGTDTPPPGTADLAITKTNGVDVVPGCTETTITYTVTVTNLGPAAVSGATLEDVPPSSLSGISWSCDSCSPPSGATLHCELDLLPDESASCTAVGVLDADAAGHLVNTATVDPPANVVDPDLGNNSATDDDPIARTTDLAITKTNFAYEVLACTAAPPYVITVTNAGPCPVDGAIVDDPFPMELLGVAWTCVATPPGATCSGGVGPLLHDTIVLPAGGSVAYTVTGDLDVDAEGVLTNTASVLPPLGVTDIDPGNNEATDEDPILRTADLEITKTNDVEEVFACEEAGYLIEVTNHGPCPADGAIVHDDFPIELLGVVWTCEASPGATCTPGMGSHLDDTVALPVGGSIEFTATGIVAKTAGDTLSNTAHVTAPGGLTDPVAGNNTATDDDPIRRRSADLAVAKDRDDDVLWPGGGDLLTYTIAVTNHGPDAAAMAMISDDFPDQLDGVTWACTPAAFCDSPSFGDIAEVIDLDPGASVTYTATGAFDDFDTGRICNTATVATMGCFFDPDASNDSDEACLVIPDCNSNGIRDAVDIESGACADVNDDHIPDKCQIGEVDWEFFGVAEGGTVVTTIEGIPGLFATCEIVVVTVAGQSAETVAANVAAAINADPCLVGQDVEAMTMGASVWVSGFLLSFSRLSIEITDPGLTFGIPLLKIPTLSAWGLALLALLIAVAGSRSLAGRRRRCRGS